VLRLKEPAPYLWAHIAFHETAGVIAIVLAQTATVVAVGALILKAGLMSLHGF
jgi:hypothetical protein